MDFLILALFCISCIGYFRFFQMTFRMTFSSAVFFSTCAALVLLMTAGIFRVILPIVCLVFSGGFLLILKDFFTLQQKRLHLHEHWLSRIKSYLRMEYVFWSAIVVFFYSYLIPYRGDLGSPDIYSAWYNQFYYMILNNTWSDNNYINYASSYAMIGNSFSYYIAKLFNDYGTQVYIFSYWVLFLNFTMPLFRFIKWRQVSCLGILWVMSFFCYYYELFSLLVSSLIWIILGGAVIFLDFRSKTPVSRLKNTGLLLLGMILFFFFAIYHFSYYPMDAVMGTLIGSIFLLYTVEICMYYKLRHVFWAALPLAVLPLIKPTGIIPAILLAFMLGITMLCRGIKTVKQQNLPRQQAFTRKRILVAGAVLAVVLMPLISYKLWGVYSAVSGFHFQHSVSPLQMVSGTIRQLKYGATEEEEKGYYERVDQMLYYGGWSTRSPGNLKSVPERCIDHVVGSVLAFGDLDFDRDLLHGKISPRAPHVYTVTILLLLFIVAACCLLKQYRKVLIWTAAGSFFFGLIIFFLQYYAVPMFTDIPGLFRYLWPGLVPLWICAALGVMLCIRIKPRTGGILLGLFLYCFCALFIWKFISVDYSKGSTIGWVMIARDNSDRFDNVVFATTGNDFLINKFLEERLAYPVKKNIYDGFTDIPPENLQGEILLVVSADEWEPKNKNLPPKVEKGIYRMRLAPDHSVVTCERIFNDQNEIERLNRIYYFADPESFQNKTDPVLLPLN